MKEGRGKGARGQGEGESGGREGERGRAGGRKRGEGWKRAAGNLKLRSNITGLLPTGWSHACFGYPHLGDEGRFSDINMRRIF